MRRDPRRYVVELLVALSALSVMGAFAVAEHQTLPKDVPAYMQEISVTIKAGFSEGSGVAIDRNGTTFVWTAGHVVDGLRSTRKVTDPKTGTQRTIIEFEDAKIIKTLVEDGRTVGYLHLDAEVIRYSDSDHGHDLAILRVRKRGAIKRSAVFYDEAKPPKLGTQLFHVGSLLGQVGSNSMTSGIVSAHGRLLSKKIFDQTDATTFPGSSGGGVYRAASGQYVGMLVRGAGEGFSLYVPVRRMRTWAKRVGVSWALDPKVKLPTEAELQKMPIGDPPGGESRGGTADMKKYPFRIHTRLEVKDEKAGS